MRRISGTDTGDSSKDTENKKNVTVQYLHSYVPKHLAVQWLLNSYETTIEYVILRRIEICMD